MPAISDVRRHPAPRSAASTSVRNAILILSGFLLGITAANVCSPKMESCACAAGAIGIIAYSLLALRSRKREVQNARRAVERATVRLERRIDQHVRCASARLLLKLHAARPHAWRPEQYVTVVQSFRSLR